MSVDVIKECWISCCGLLLCIKSPEESLTTNSCRWALIVVRGVEMPSHDSVYTAVFKNLIHPSRSTHVKSIKLNKAQINKRVLLIPVNCHRPRRFTFIIWSINRKPHHPSEVAGGFHAEDHFNASRDNITPAWFKGLKGVRGCVWMFADAWRDSFLFFFNN